MNTKFLKQRLETRFMPYKFEVEIITNEFFIVSIVVCDWAYIYRTKDEHDVFYDFAWIVDHLDKLDEV